MKQVKNACTALRISYVITIFVSIAASAACEELLYQFGFGSGADGYYSADSWIGFRITFFLLFLFIMTVGLILPVSWIFRKKYSRNFRGYFFDNALKKYFKTVEWEPAKGYDKKFIESLGIINTGYRFKSDNLFMCTDENLHFEMADVKITTYWVQEAGRAAKKQKMTNPSAINRFGYAFHGQWMALDTNKNCNSNIIILPNMVFDANLSSTFGGNKITTGLLEFDQRFIVYCDNPQDARDILQENVLLQLFHFAKNPDCWYYFGFEGNKLYIGVHSVGMGKYLKIGSSFQKINEEEVQKEADDNVRAIKTLLVFLNT